MVIMLHLIGIDGLAVYLPPSIEDISQHEWHEQRHIEHGGKRKLTAATVSQRQRTLQICHAGVIGRVVIASQQQEGCHRQYGTCTCEPDATTEGALHQRPEDAIQHQYHTSQLHDRYQRQGHEVVQVLENFHRHDARSGVNGKAFLDKQMHEPSEEERQEEDSVKA